MQMGLMICDFYRMKVERLPTHLQYAGFYVRAGEKPPAFALMTTSSREERGIPTGV
jgi:hypothetical protein